VIRTRFAPSPTGYLHVGGLRTALYNYLYAKKHQGAFILRIEDTDQRRKIEGAVENLISALKWAGVCHDEGPDVGGEFGPYIQSQRLSVYREHINQLIEAGHAYHCFCSADRLKSLREQQIAENQNPRYDNLCRKLSKDEAEQRIAAGESSVVRMKVPTSGFIEIYDLVRGKVSFACDLLEDQILLKSDGFPTYHLANVVDDHYMQISHVIRGEEWLPSTPKHKLLYEYFGWKLPQFAHLPLLLNADRSKLSKRQGDVAVEDYLRKGYLPEALINFLALLGWNPGTNREIFSLEELTRAFSLKRINKAGAIFNPEKLQWMNGQYIRALKPENLLKLAGPYLPDDEACQEWPKDKLREILLLLQPYLTTLSDIPEKGSFFFNDPVLSENPELQDLIRTPEFHAVLTSLKNKVVRVEIMDSAAFHSMVKTVQQETGVTGKQLWTIIRVAIIGREHGPDISKIAEILGKNRFLKRLDAALEING